MATKKVGNKTVQVKTPKKPKAVVDESLSLKAWEKSIADPVNFKNGPPLWQLHIAFPGVPEDKFMNFLNYMAALIECATDNLLEESIRHQFPDTPNLKGGVVDDRRYRLYHLILAALTDTADKNGFAKKPKKNQLS